jgi:hypothetical protein
MKKVTQGLWSVTDGKGDRHYLHCDDSKDDTGVGFIHPEQVSLNNGLGMYGYESLHDLAIAILLFERKAGRGKKLADKFNSI